MPYRNIPLVSGEVYHVFNRTIDDKVIFGDPRNCERLLTTFLYYRLGKPRVSYSKLLELDKHDRERIWQEALNNKELFRVNVLAYCLMPNHFHLLLRQQKDKGISRFVADSINSFTKYYNAKKERKGSLFLAAFKAMRIENDEEFIHVSRYIHLNPYSSGVVKGIESLVEYKWSSFREYLDQKKDGKGLAWTKDILDLFDNSATRYKDFVLSNADYQRALQYLKYAEGWK